MTILAVSVLDDKPINTGFTMTGTISANGSIGEIGGVYDKVSAAKAAGINFVLVPKVSNTDPEDELYLLVQTNFGIPLIQVANISQAAYFALTPNPNIQNNLTTYNFYTNYNVSSLPNASINCTQSCNYDIFYKLLNSTFNLTRGEINQLASNPKFANVSSQLGLVLNQSAAIGRHGYIYTAADFAFIDYVNAFYFNGYPSNRGQALQLLYSIKGFCSTLNPPPLTTTNYNYVLSAELRQYWGNYTINQTIAAYNTSSIESDEILDELYLGAQSNGWCAAANLVYNESNQPGTYVQASGSLSSLAYSRIQRALPYGDNLYIATAEQAYSQNNFPVAILDADYAYALESARPNKAVTNAQLNSISLAIAQNSTFGVWATEFAKEVQFYVSESNITNNATLAKAYSESAYSAALLAQQLSNDTQNINQGLVVVSQPVTQQQQNQVQSLTKYVNSTQELVIAMFAVIIVLLAINTVLILILMNKIKSEAKNVRRSNKRKK